MVYAGLLTWSGVYRHYVSPTPIPKDRNTVEVNEVEGGRIMKQEIRLAYKEFEPEKIPAGELPVILVHGSPGDADVFNGLAEMMPGRKMISVDLPGFGYSEHEIPDYSIKAHATYVFELLERLNIEKAHLVGFSLGGGVITHLAAEHPDRVASLSYVSAIGIQEYELFGNYPVNHFIHGVQLAFFWGLTELTPHFGVFDGMAMPYARNFYDSDQRPLRKLMMSIDQPVLIVHGKNDPLVPVAAAREHARIIPQSEYHEMDENHFYVFMRPVMVEPALLEFWNKVESDKAETRLNASAERLNLAAEPFNPTIVPATGATALVLFFLIAILAIANQDLAFIVAGLFAAQGRFGFTFAVISCLFGIVISIAFLVYLGRRRSGLTGRSLASFFGGKRSIRQYRKVGRRGLPGRIIYGLTLTGFFSRYYFLTGALERGFWRTFFLNIVSAVIRAAFMIGFFLGLSELVTSTGSLSKTDTSLLLVSLVGVYLFAFLVAQFHSPLARNNGIDS